MLSRRVFAIALCALLAACSGAPATQAPPNGTGAPTSQGTGTLAPATGAPLEDGPLPEPTLTSIDDIIAAMDDSARAEQVVVSLLTLLGIGLYQPDGAPIRKGTETSDADFYVFEPVARGLAEMLRERGDPDSQLPFAAFHAGLVAAGYTGSIEELAAGYADAYAGQPGAPMSKLIEALGPIDVDATLSTFEVWLLVLDGFIPPNGAATAMADANGGPPAVAASGGWSVARRNFRRGGGLPDDWPELANQLSAVLHSWRITMTATPGSVHEGHGGAEGSPATITAHLVGPRTALTSPFSGASIVPAPSGPAGAPLAWVAGSTASAHGSITDPATAIDANGEATTTYVPKSEAADGQGVDREEHGVIHAGVQRRQLAFALYGSFITPYAMFMESHVKNQVVLNLDWHEKMEAVINIVWTDFYDGVEDRIIFLGTLTGSEPNPISGGVMYTGKGTATGSRAGWAACNPGIDVVPSGTVEATFNAFLTGSDEITISAYADIMTQLSGISTAPMTVPIAGGTAIFTSTETGELCPHSSDGELTLTGLTLPH